MATHKTYFDNYKLTNVKFYLNSKFFSYGDLNLDFDKCRTAILYDMFVRFRTFYYQISMKEVKHYSGQILLEIAFL